MLGTEVFLLNSHKGLSSCPTRPCLSMRYVGELVWTQKGEVTCLKSHSADKASRALGFSLFHVPKEDSLSLSGAQVCITPGRVANQKSFLPAQQPQEDRPGFCILPCPSTQVLVEGMRGSPYLVGWR